MLCEYKVTELPNGKYLHECQRENCGRKVILTTNRFVSKCKSGPEYSQPKSTLWRLGHFTTEAISHFLNGSPTCTQEEIDTRLAICAGTEPSGYKDKCEHFVVKDPLEPKIGVCNECGCNISQDIKYLNALGWRDRKCPKDKWGIIPSSGV